MSGKISFFLLFAKRGSDFGKTVAIFISRLKQDFPMIEIVRAKLHGIHVTGCDLAYHGSITLDPLICREAGIYPLEFVYIWNKNTGARISTYVIYGDPGSHCCILNGAAARSCQKGDTVIICASEYIADKTELYAKRPCVLTFNDDNSIAEKLAYEVVPTKESGQDKSGFDMHIVKNS